MLEATVDQQTKQMEVLTAQIQKVSAHIEMSKTIHKVATTR
jgi:hypothetical protein